MMARIEDPPPDDRHLRDVVTLREIGGRARSGRNTLYVVVPAHVVDRLGWSRGNRVAVEDTLTGRVVLTNLSLEQHHVARS